ncbi:Compactin diketide synthase mokB [Naviculisporaceae sp. PSN 640]
MSSDNANPNVSAILAEDGSMPIAVVGIACRFPGDATNPDKLWDMISAGKNAHGTWPKDRLNIDAFYHPNPEHGGTFNTKGGHFMNGDVTGFDAPFFSITAKEAHAMDPQQRIALELAYEGLENAGIRIQDVAGTNMGCYMATFAHDYFRLRIHDVEDIPMYEGTGNGQPLLAARLSWFFDLKGPSFVLDTACSSTLVALHLACQSLRTGESTSAIVGGANIMFMPELPLALSNLHFLSPDARCKSFDASANGYARGEGAAVVILKPLEAALRDGNVIRAVIRGTGVNQDGRTPGITVPSAQSQEALIRSTYAAAGLNFRDTQYFEAHGTGTPVGDPLECSAIGATFGQERSEEHPQILVGSIKPNIGHLEAVAGLAGVIKSIYCVEKGLIPPVVYYEKPNPRIDMEGWKLKIPTRLLPWPTKGIRRVSINSFGYGGTNGHCIIDDAYHYLKERGLTGAHNTSPGGISTPASVLKAHAANSPNVIGGGNVYSGPRLLIWSSHEQKGTDGRAAALAEYLESHTSKDEASNLQLLDKLAFTLSNKRSRFQWRSFAVVSTIDAAKAALSNPSKPVRAQDNPALSFVFTGQGAQWFGMGRELMAYPVYRESIEAAATYMKNLGADWDLQSELSKDEESSRVGEALISQPACTAVQVAIVELLASWGVKPQVVSGHSSGEIGAAYAKGAITREAAWLIAYHRGRLSSSIKQHGAMMAVGLGEADANTHIEKVLEDDESGGKIVVACINSPSSVTISGDTNLIDKLGVALEQEKIFNRKLAVKVAYHSPHMQTIADEYLHSIKGLRSMIPEHAAESTVRMFSSVTGDLIEASSLLEPSYWVSNLVNPVKFDHALKAAIMHNPAGAKRRTARASKSFQVSTIVEIGPHAALQGPIKQIVASLASSSSKSATIPYVSILTRKVSAAESALSAIGSLVQQGYSPDVASANNPRSIPLVVLNQTHQLTDIPPVVWNRSTEYWHEAPATKAFRFRALPRHDLVGLRDEYSSDAEPSWRNYLRVAELPWIEHHQVQNSNLYPFAGMLVMAIEAARQTADPTRQVEGYRLRDIQAGAAMVIPHDSVGGKEGKLETRLQLRPWRTGTKSLDHTWNEFTISSRNDEGLWTQNCTGLVTIQYVSTTSSQAQAFTDEAQVNLEAHRDSYSRLKASNPPQVPVADFYGFINKLGVQLGGVFQVLRTIGSGHYESICDLVISDTAALMPENYEHDHIIHPTTLDGVVQMAALAATEGGLTVDRAKIPKFIDGVWVSAKMFDKKAGSKLVGYSKSKPMGKNEYVGEAVVSDETWEEELVKIDGCRTVALETLEESGKTETTQDHELITALTKVGSRHVWAPDVEVTPTEALKKYLEHRVRHIEDTDPSFMFDLEHMSYIFCKRGVKAVEDRGLHLSGSKLSAHHRHLYEYMRRRVDNAPNYTLHLQPAKGSDRDWLKLSQDEEDAVLKRASTHGIDGALIYQVGTHLDAILAGEIEPLQVLREENRLTNYYREAYGATRIQKLIAEYVRCLSHKRPLKVLEVGAGTGGTTSSILTAFGNASQTANRLISYTYTDLSSGFFEKAAEEFEEWSNFLEFRVLDIEKHPRDQGYVLGEYDLIVASNVLHATSSIGKVLGHCRSLLKLGGAIVLGEITNTLAARVPMIVGCLPGWWMGTGDGRKDGPLVSEERWDTLLREQGFGGIELKFRDFKQMPDTYLTSLMVASAGPVPALPEPPLETVIVTPNNTERLGSWVDKVTANLQAVSSQGNGLITTVTISQASDVDLKGKPVIVALETQTPFLATIDKSEEFEAIKKIILTARSTLWLTRGGAVDCPTPEANVIVGLARSIRSEVASATLVTLDLDPNDAGSDTEVKLLTRIFQAHLDENNNEYEFAIRDGQVQVLRQYSDAGLSHVFDKAQQDIKSSDTVKLLPYGGYPDSSASETERIPLRLDIKTPGVLDTLRFVDDSEEFNKPLGDHEVEIFVKAIPLNFHDVMFALGNVDTSMEGDDDGMGVECSGIISRVGKGAAAQFSPGDRVVTCYIGSFRTYVRNHWTAVHKIPKSMSFEEAASFTSVYAAAIYALKDLARIQPGESVLVHAASGGFGQAAIVIAQHAGAGAIYATVGSEAKKQILVEHYGIPAAHILNSRDHLSFSAGLKRLTNNRGVDIVLNSLAGESLRESWLSLAPFGRFIELGKNDMFKNAGLDMLPFLKNTTFTGLNMGAIFNHNTPLSARLLRDVMALHTRGIVKPIRPVTSLPFSQIEEAFRTMAGGKHIGKIVLIPNDDDQVPMVPPPALISARQKSLDKTRTISLRPDATYLMPGGLGGLGRVIARWFASKGARYLAFTSRSGASSPQAKALLEELTSKGVQTKVLALDIGSKDGFSTLLSSLSASDFPPVRGVIIFAMQIRDIFVENMSLEDFQASAAPKINITRNVDELLPNSDELDFFISMSSIAGVVGSRGQGNYNAGNTFQDALARRRRARGQKGTSICLGIVEDIGFAADQGVAEQHRYLDEGAAIFLSSDDVVKAIEDAIITSSATVDEEAEDGYVGLNGAEAILGLSTGGLLKAGGYDDPYWFHESRFGHFRVCDTQLLNEKNLRGKHKGGAAGGSGEEIRAALGAAKTIEEASAVALTALTRKLARAMMMEEADLDPESPANSYGIDSLVAVEIRAWVFKELRSEVSVFEILSNASLSSLAAMVAQRSTLVKVRANE